ncbi:MAG: tRNA uridine-5-carboxymethylaminomethyl(34) synthesis enzyme MnmG [Crocinitomicaceae bacterium]
MEENFDVIVVGAGHAGCEAAHAAGKMGKKVLLITMNMNTIAQMSCNPATGGVAKGQIMREIDALGGMSGIVSDMSAIQFRMLNRSKGPAMWSPRAQNDRFLYSKLWRQFLEENENVCFWQDSVVGLLIEKDSVVGVQTKMNEKIYSKRVVITAGTFMNGLIHVGLNNFQGGRVGDEASLGLSDSLLDYGFIIGRMKTGTPPRVDGRSLDYTKMEEQPGDENPSKFSFDPQIKPLQEQRSCWITYTNNATHEILESGFDKSPMFTGRIKSLGPRYCPSIEDKINRFKERERHQIFVEPEGWDTIEIYVNGFSTSLPMETQFNAIKTIPGFEHVRFFRPGYAIEYDYFNPIGLRHTLESKHLNGLYLAGQVNGTTGYEEAACQGLIAGVNAALAVDNKPPFILGRDESYIGVLIDDLVLKGTEEPYRMFTSRAEFRILLRQDNADARLSTKGYELGLLSTVRYKAFLDKYSNIQKAEDKIMELSADPIIVNEYLSQNSSAPLKQKVKYNKVISRPNVDLIGFCGVDSSLREIVGGLTKEEAESLEISIKYEGYIKREKDLADKMRRLEDVKIPKGFEYNSLSSLSSEAREKLSNINPQTIGEASRISGVSPSDISVLLVACGR